MKTPAVLREFSLYFSSFWTRQHSYAAMKVLLTSIEGLAQGPEGPRAGILGHAPSRRTLGKSGRVGSPRNESSDAMTPPGLVISLRHMASTQASIDQAIASS